MPTTISRSLKILSLIQVLVAGVLGLVLSHFFGPRLGASFAVGAALMLLNVLLLAWTAWRTLEKKPVAWTVPIIVIKYAVLLGSVFIFARTEWFHPLGAGLGVASFLIAALGVAVLTQIKEQRKEINLGSSSL